jgi:hypothetical protein
MPPLQPPSAGPDIVFHCSSCRGALIVDAAAAGMRVTCQHCGQSTCVPPPRATVPSCRLGDIERELRENESQRTEVTGYINQLCIQMHRWKLRLKTLNERKSQLESELSEARK